MQLKELKFGEVDFLLREAVLEDMAIYYTLSLNI